MSLIAGIASRDFRAPVPERLVSALGRSLSPREPAALERLGTPACRLFKADFGLLGSPGLVREGAGPLRGTDVPWSSAHRSGPAPARPAHPSGADPSDLGPVTLLAGELLLDDAHAPRTRQDELEQIAPRLTPDGAGRALREARGTFALARFQPGAPSLLLASDPLGLRPLFVFESEAFVAFASVLPALEALFDGGPPLDVVGLGETLLWGRGLSDRTAFRPIRRVPHATVLHYTPGGKSQQMYVDWGAVRPHRTVDADYLRELRACFDRAVALRRRGDRAVRAFLTGGMDSRAIVTTLLGQGAAVESHCYALPASQEAVFARMFAQRAGTSHVERPSLPPPGRTPYDVLADVVSEEGAGDLPATRVSIDRPGTAWGGDGGSVIMGHVKFTPECLAAARRAGKARGIARVQEEGQIALPPRPFRPELREWFPAAATEGMIAQADELGTEDPAQGVFLAFVLSRQTGSVAREFARLDRTRIEPLYPFFDAAFVAKVLEASRAAFSRHGAYTRWFDHFPALVRAVPWQVYPGSDPCPVPAPVSLPAQWDESQLARQGARHRRWSLARARPAVWARRFPAALLHRPTVLAMYALTRTRLRDYGYALDPTWRVFELFRRSNRRGVFPSGDDVSLEDPAALRGASLWPPRTTWSRPAARE